MTGMTAANEVVRRMGGQLANVLPVEADEPHIALGRQVVRQAREAISRFGLRSPFL